MRKRHKHRGGKKKQRRKSFAIAPPPRSLADDDGANDDVGADPLKDTAAASSRDEYFDIHHNHNLHNLHNRSLSTTSLESESLLDHRDQQHFLRARRPSVVVAQSQSSRQRQADGYNDNVDHGDDINAETAPLLLSEQRLSGATGSIGNDLPSMAATRTTMFGGYGTTPASYNDGPRPSSRGGSSHSSIRRKKLNPFSPYTPTAERYSNVNYPPSVPGSPPLRPTGRLLDHSNLSFGDQMLRDELRTPSSPSALRRSDTSTSKSNLNDLLGDRDRERDSRGRQTSTVSGGEGDTIGNSNSNNEDGASKRGGGAGSGGENDVCFPQEHMSELAEEDDYDHDAERERDAAAWRTRGNRRRRAKWPDLSILDEWSRFEKEGRSDGRRAVKKIKEPQLINGRLRPVHKGWHRAEEDAPYRFTYFNEEFQSTIHSQSISELVQPGGSFRELFIPDPPILSDSESEDDLLIDADGNAFESTVMSGLDEAEGLSRHPIMAAEALANAGDTYDRPGARSGGSISPEKNHGSSATPLADGVSPRSLQSQRSTATMMERTPTQASVAEDADQVRPSFTSPPRVSSPLMHQGLPTDKYPSRTGSPGPSPVALTPHRQAERENLRAAVTTAAAVAAVDAAKANANGGEYGRTSSRISENHTSTPAGGQTPRQLRYGERPVWWLDVLSPTEAEMKILSKAFGIHPLTAEDIVMQEAREKVELFHHYYFVSYRSFDQDPSSETFLDPVNMYVVVFREGVLSFHFSMTPHPANVRRRIRQLSDYMILSSDWISYAIIDDITDVFVPLIQKIEEEVDEIDDAILQMHSSAAANLERPSKPRESSDTKNNAAATAEADTNMLLRVGDCRKRVMSLYRLLGNKADVIKGFAKRCNEHWDVAPRSEIGLYLGDIQDHIVTMTSNLSHYEKILSRSHGNYLAQINIRMNERQEQTADVLGKLTVLGTIVLPMNIITGLWGMNVWVPGQDGEGDLRYFMVITAGLLAFGMACYWIAKRVYQIV
ncbi:CorA metal ion transporter [Sporothrix epigloea]|uniref:CorA metal ion transporter n=1 Tax=Sporothrix epigloea TaxID=1892477 RepID=A0ABP0DWX3_9PEZI